MKISKYLLIYACYIYLSIKICKYVYNIHTCFFSKTYAHVNTFIGPLLGLGKHPCK